MRRIAGRLAKIDNEKEFPEYQRKIALSGTFTSPLNHELGLHLLFYAYVCMYI